MVKRPYNVVKIPYFLSLFYRGRTVNRWKTPASISGTAFVYYIGKMDTKDTKENTVNKPNIISSHAHEASVEVQWSDGLGVFFASGRIEKDPCVVNANVSDGELARRVTVSRTSAKVTLAGCPA